MFTASIRPEFHTDTGRTETFIRSARHALTYEESPDQIFARLIKAGADAGEAHCAMVAAAMLGGL
jgi:hypothetical protein